MCTWAVVLSHMYSVGSLYGCVYIQVGQFQYQDLHVLMHYTYTHNFIHSSTLCLHTACIRLIQILVHVVPSLNH